MNKTCWQGLFCLSLLFLFMTGCEKADTPAVTQTEGIQLPWSWENPYSFQTIEIPGSWEETASSGMEETLLTLQHSSGRSIVYIMNEEAIQNLDLDEYREAMMTVLQRDTGIEEFEQIEDVENGPYLQGSGAKYLGETLAGSYSNIWTTGELTFWRAVSITNLEYKSLEYEARDLVDLLRKSSY